ncbi:hypothetical protein Tco_0732840 [Tanacetum coccineum]
MSQPANDEFSQHLSDDEASNHEDASDTGAAPKQQQQVIPQTTAISNIKLPILKKEEYDIWAMEMEHYLEYIDNDVWKVIQNGNSKKRISTGKDGVIRILPPVTAAEIQAVEKERKAKNILLMAIPKEHMRRFHGMDDAKEIWEAIRTRFGGNANSKKMQKAVFKQQFEAFTISSSEGLEKGYDRFQQLLSQLEAHGAEVSTEDANHKFLRSLPPACSCTPSTSSTNVPEKEVLAGFADEVIYSLFAKQTEDLDLLHEDLEQLMMDDGIVHWEKLLKQRIKSSLMAISQAMRHEDEDSIVKAFQTIIYRRPLFLKGVPPAYLKLEIYTPQPQEEIDDALYVYGKKGPQKPKISVSDDNSSEHSTCQSNDSEGSCGNTSEHSFETESESLDEPNEMSKSRLEVTNEKDVSVPESTEVAPSCVSYIKTPRQPLKDNETHKVNRKSWNDMMKRELGEVNTVSPKVNSVSTTSNSISPKRPQMDQINQRRDFSKSYSSVRRPFAKSTAQMAHANAVMGSWGSAVKSSASYNWRNSRPNFNYNSGPTLLLELNITEETWVRIETHGGSVTFGGSKGYISGKGRIRVGNLDFDSVSFVKELGHFNLFSISQICDKQHKVLFTETECLVVSSDFKMPDENQKKVLLEETNIGRIFKCFQGKEKSGCGDLLFVPSAVKIPEEKEESRTDFAKKQSRQNKLALESRRNLVLTDSEEEEPDAQGRKSEDDPLDSSVQGLITPPTTKSNGTKGERRYKRRKETKGKKVVSSLDFQEEFDAVREQVESLAPISFETTKASLKRFGEELQDKTPKRLKDDKDVEAKGDEPTRKSGRRKQMARKAMKTPSVATYKIIKQGEKGVYQIVREDGTDIAYWDGGQMDNLEKESLGECLRLMFEETSYHRF